MSEAKRRADAYKQAKAELFGEIGEEEDSQIVAGAAITLFERFFLPNRYTGGCYLTTMFLHRYLAKERGIMTEPIVGYVNDGTDDVFISHAWIEHRGRKVDITLHLNEHPQEVHTGGLVVLDKVLLPGSAAYSYHRELNAAGEAANAGIAEAGGLGAAVLRHKRAEHAAMSLAMADWNSMEQHQSLAPLGLRYADMRASLRHGSM